MNLKSIKLFNLVRNSSFKLFVKPNCVTSISLKKFYHSSDRYYNEENEDKPVKYTTSDAHLKHKSYKNYRFSDEEVAEEPRYQRPVVIVSFVIFFIYFGILRESNDVDQKLNASLFETVPELELPLIESAIKNHQLLGLDTTELRKRFQELQELKQELDNKKN